jgi:hypothetical protein
MRRGRNTSSQPAHSTVPCVVLNGVVLNGVVLNERHERYPGASHRMDHRRIQWRKRTDLASAIVYERRIRELRLVNSLNGPRFNWRLGFRDVPFGLSFLFPHGPSDNTARTKILDRTPYRHCQQRDRLCNCIANVTAWFYSRKPVLHLHICVQHAVVAQGTNTHKSRSGAATGW